MTRTRWIAGCMTGTSLDGLDVALAEIEGTGLDMKATFRGMVSRPLGDLAKQLRHFAEGNAAPPIEYLRAARELGELHADAVEELCKKHLQNRTNSTDLNTTEQSPPTPVGGLSALPNLDFIVAHGQTIWHAPAAHVSWQLFDPWPLVHRLRVPVCYDLRQADLIAGGQGAPITPIADWVLWRSETVHRLIINFGGICNVTSLPRGGATAAIEAEDVGPCNLLLDGLVQRLFPGRRFDDSGKIASSGRRTFFVRGTVIESPFFARPRPRTAGREDFNDAWLDSLLEKVSRNLSDPRDIIASAAWAVAEGICNAYDPQFGFDEPNAQIICAGGGVRNDAVMNLLRENFGNYGHRVMLTDELGIPCEAREALAFAILGALSQDGVPITLPQVTGSTNPGRAGAWAYP